MLKNLFRRGKATNFLKMSQLFLEFYVFHCPMFIVHPKWKFIWVAILVDFMLLLPVETLSCQHKNELQSLQETANGKTYCESGKGGLCKRATF